MAKKNIRVFKQQQHKINDEIRFNQVRLVGENIDGGNTIKTSREALVMAEELEMDLVLINADSDTPTCKIMNYRKFIYDQDKNKGKNKALPLKEIQLSPNIGENDLNTKVAHIIKFLEKGHKVKTLVQFKGRQMAHQDLGLKVLLTVATTVVEYGTPEAIPERAVGKSMIMFLKPKNNG